MAAAGIEGAAACLCGDAVDSTREVPVGRCRALGCDGPQVEGDALNPYQDGFVRRPIAAWCRGHRYLNWALADFLPYPRGDGRRMCAGCRPWLEPERHGPESAAGLGFYFGLTTENFHAEKTSGAGTRAPTRSPERLRIDAGTLDRLARERVGRDAAEALKTARRSLASLAADGRLSLEAFAREGCGWRRAEADRVGAALRRLGVAEPEDLTKETFARWASDTEPAAQRAAGVPRVAAQRLIAAASAFYGAGATAAGE